MTPAAQPRRSRTGTAALTAASISALGLAGLVIGRLIGAKGFQSNSNTNTSVSYLCFFAFTLALVIALAAGAAAWLTGHRNGRRRDIRAGRTAAVYFLVAIIIAVTLNAVDW